MAHKWQVKTCVLLCVTLFIYLVILAVADDDILKTVMMRIKIVTAGQPGISDTLNKRSS